MVPDRLSMTIDVDRSQKARFDRFYADDIRCGTLPFLMSDPTSSGWRLLSAEGDSLLTEGSVPLLIEETWICMLGDALPAETIYGVRFRITFDLAVMP